MESNTSAYNVLKCMKILVPVVGIGIVLTTVTFALVITTLVKVNQGFDNIQGNGIMTTSVIPTVPTNPPITTVNPTTPGTNQPPTTSNQPPPTTNPPLFNATLPTYLHIQDVMNHLNELQRIATAENDTRAIDTSGFNQTLDYITNTLSANTNYNIIKSFFPVRRFALASDPILSSVINGTMQNYTYSTNLSIADFYYIQYSTSTNFSDYVQISVIHNLGCRDEDWLNASLPVAGRVALVQRGNCTFIEKGELASKYNATAFLIYNDGESTNRTQPIGINLGQANELPALSLSSALGQELADAAQNPSNNVSVRITIAVRDDLPISVGNICADTPTGDVTQTIVIGSHSDSVPEGPGINDNGSGSAANLGLAIALAKLFQTPTYAQYKYRVRFCWWGAEEVGLLGSDDHVKKAKNSTVVGERLQDYLINLNYDMLASPNYIFGIYDGRTANNDTPAVALPGSNKMTDLFKDWFIQQNLPWDYTDFSGRSDYGPFLAEGIVAGGLFSGAEQNKTLEQRDRYDQTLGQGSGGLSDVAYDQCYHKACDSIENINIFAYAQMVQAAAYVLEYLARQDDLNTWLYPNGRPTRSNAQSPQRKYNSINEFFGFPYF